MSDTFRYTAMSVLLKKLMLYERKTTNVNTVQFIDI